MRGDTRAHTCCDACPRHMQGDTPTSTCPSGCTALMRFDTPASACQSKCAVRRYCDTSSYDLSSCMFSTHARLHLLLVEDTILKETDSTEAFPEKYSTNSSSEFGRQQRQITELCALCNVPLVHRTYIFLLFKGDPSEYVYMEVEFRRLSFLKQTIANDAETLRIQTREGMPFKLLGFVEPSRMPKEMFGLILLPRTKKVKSSGWRFTKSFPVYARPDYNRSTYEQLLLIKL
ncbi:hypothetical protein F2Q69_00012676 [Brassica cretica]|uniref:NPK1-activating kinesin-like protein C-terminal domain-containing protein n=1 Tax=Brassica cretica TaxID=69181 RepID=A0A8S9R728_BRACR|nr:hypothetical protein F2Q69_00012676 [Brassica cretica]